MTTEETSLLSEEHANADKEAKRLGVVNAKLTMEMVLKTEHAEALQEQLHRTGQVVCLPQACC